MHFSGKEALCCELKIREIIFNLQKELDIWYLVRKVWRLGGESGENLV